MQNITYQLEDGTLNGVYDKIYNCMVVKPTYEKNGLYSKKFMLDKRLGTKKINNLYKPGYTFTDVINIDGEKYYLANKDDKAYLFFQDGTRISNGINIDENSPIRIQRGDGAGGTKIKEGTLDIDGEGLDDVSQEGLYDSGYIKLKVTGCSVGQFIVFKDGLLKGATNRIEYVDGDYIYILGTNTRGTIPVNGQGYIIYSESKDTILIGGTDGLFLYNVNGNELIEGINILPLSIYDIVEYNGNILSLTNKGIFYSKATHDGNTNIYPKDEILIKHCKSLIYIGVTLLAIGDNSKSYLIKDIVSKDGSIGYIAHNLGLTSSLYSKYSYIYKDSIFMILTNDGRLPTVNIVNKTQSLSQTELNYSDSMFRGLFADLGEKIYGNEDGKFYHLITHKDGKTIIYELDFEYKHWIIHTYDFLIYKKMNGEILGRDGVYSIEGYNDLGIEYTQEINFSTGDTLQIIQPIESLRTIFGLTGERFEVKLELEIELGARIQYLSDVLTNYKFDLSLDKDPTGNELVGFENVEKYDGTIVSIQKLIQRTGRYARIKYSSKKRFILGESKIFYSLPQNPLINEVQTSG